MVKATWAERQEEALAIARERAQGKRGFLSRLIFRDDNGADTDRSSKSDDDAVGWWYKDDFGREQGPFSTERMRIWIKKGYLTNDRLAKKTGSEEFEPVSEWQELDASAGTRRAKGLWKTTRAAVKVGMVVGGTSQKIQGGMKFDEIAAASQQRYARSSVGFDAMLLRSPFFRSTPPAQWPAALVDALTMIVELATADVLSHVIGHFDCTNLGVELLVELLSLCFWYTRPPVRLKEGLAQVIFAPLNLAVQRQWCLVMKKLAVWRRSLATHAYLELARICPERTADYAHALQFVDWSPADQQDARDLSEYLRQQLGLAKSLQGEAQLHHTRALTFTIEQLRLPMLPSYLAEEPMVMVHEWCGFAMRTASDADEIWQAAQQRRARRRARREARRKAMGEVVLDDEDAFDEEDAEDEEFLLDLANREEGFVEGGGNVVTGERLGLGASVLTAAGTCCTAGGSAAGSAAGSTAVMAGGKPQRATGGEVASSSGAQPTTAEQRLKALAEAEHAAELSHERKQITLLELAVACVAQSSREFFFVQAPAVIEALRPHLWRPLSVEPALHCVLRLLRGCYHPTPPYWVADEHAVASSGAALAKKNEAQDVELGRYAVTMHPAETTVAHLIRLAHLQAVLFPGWGEPRGVGMKLVYALAESSVGGLVRATGVAPLSELPHAGQLIEVLAEIVVCMAAHAVQWAVQEVIMPFLKFRKRSDASAPYAMVGMRALALMLDPKSDFTSANSRMQLEVPKLLAPAIRHMLRAAHAQCGLQHVGMRYYPLPVDTPDGQVPEHWSNLAPSVAFEFGPHPLHEKRALADVDTVLEMIESHPPEPPTPAEETAVENARRAQSTLKLIAYRGGMALGGTTASSLKRSFGRTFVGVTKVEQWTITLDPQLIWNAHTHGAPGRSLLAHETVLAHIGYAAALANTFPEDGRSVDDWAQLYQYALGVLPLFDPSSIPADLVVNSEGRSFLFKALAHPDERVGRAAAHAMQRIMRHHMALRVPLFKAMLALMGRVPETDVAVRTTGRASAVTTQSAVTTRSADTTRSAAPT